MAFQSCYINRVPAEVLQRIFDNILAYDKLVHMMRPDMVHGKLEIDYSLLGDSECITSQVKAIFETSHKFHKMGAKVFFMKNTFFSTFPDDYYMKIGLSTMLFWLTSIGPHNRKFVQNLTFGWQMMAFHFKQSQQYHYPIETHQQKFFDLLQETNLVNVDIVTYGSVVGHTKDSDPLEPKTIRYSPKFYYHGKESATGPHTKHLRAWIEDVRGAAELKALPNLKKVIVRGKDALSRLALQKFLGGIPIPDHMKNDPETYRWNASRPWSSDVPYYGEIDNTITFMVRRE